MATTTTRRQRTRKATTTAIVPRSPFVGFEDAHKLIWAANFVYSAAAPVMEIDRDGFNVSLDRCRMEEQAALAENHAHLDAVHRAINSGRDVGSRYDGSAYEAAYRGTMAGCGDAVTFTQSVTTIPVADVQGATTLGPLDADQQRRCDAVFGPEDSSGPAEPDPPAGPEEDRSEEIDDPALDKAPVIRVSSNPVPLDLAPGPIPVGEWKKPGSEDGEQS